MITPLDLDLPIDPPLPQLLQQSLRVQQVAAVEALGEAAVDRGEEGARFGALAVIAPQAGEAGRRAQLEGAGALPPGDRERARIAGLGLEGLGAEFALEPSALLERIADNPVQFPEIGEGIRRALLHRFPYAVYFLISEDTPVIVAVLHQHRKPDAWRGCRR